jgi:hypothetical protein
MLEKTGILFVILILLLVFYLVIRLGAGKKKDIAKSQEITMLFKRNSYFNNYISNSSFDLMVFFELNVSETMKLHF